MFANQIVHCHFPIIESTNTWAKAHLASLDRDKITLITADEQTAGRGRFKRKWISPPKQNIYATFCFFVDKKRYDISNIPQVLAVSTAKVLESMGLSPKIKWPNDVLVKDKKIAGILCETTPIADNLGVVLGIGININMPWSQLREIDQPATSLYAEKGVFFDVDQVLGLVRKHFMNNLILFLKEGFDPFVPYYAATRYTPS